MNDTNQDAFALEPAQLKWDSTGQPVSERYNDIYFSKDDGLAETHYVFIEANRLPQRFSNDSVETSAEPFTIAETGFGTGLNFLCAASLWLEHADSNRALHYVSVEKHPLSQSDLTRSLNQFALNASLKEALIAQYPDLIRGTHTLQFANGHITLHLIFDDANTAINNHSFTADAWFLDGFNPASNDSMWKPSLLESVAEHSKPGTTFSTFTAAGNVKRGLIAAGFQVSKQKGFGRKREMLVGHLPELSEATPFHASMLPRWTYPDPRCYQHTQPNQTRETDVAVIGGGLAGTMTALEFSRRGYKTTLFDKRDQLLGGASGPSHLVMYTKLPAIANLEARLAVRSTLFSIRFLEQFQTLRPDYQFWSPRGVLLLSWNAQEAARNEKRARHYHLPSSFMQLLKPDQAKHITGMDVESGGLWFPRNGALNIPEFRNAIAQIGPLSKQLSTQVDQLDFDTASHKWHLSTTEGMFSAPIVVIANAYMAKHFVQSSQFNTSTIHGQTAGYPSIQAPQPKCIICADGYLVPDDQNGLHIGASYNLERTTESVSDQEHSALVEKITRWSGNWLTLPPKGPDNAYHSTSGLRCTTTDYQPIVGPVPVTKDMEKRFSPLRSNAKACTEVYGSYHPGLYVNIGHGSKGLISTPIAAHYIASLVQQTPSPLEASHMKMLSPSRFTIKQLIRSQSR